MQKRISIDNENKKYKITVITLVNIEPKLIIFAEEFFVEEFKRQVECLGENTEKYITFSVLTNKELENNKAITYKIRFIDSIRFMSSSLSDLADILSEGLYNDKHTRLLCNAYQPKMNY